MNKIFLIILAVGSGMFSACDTVENRLPTTNNKPGASSNETAGKKDANKHSPGENHETPAPVKAYFPEAEISVKEKDLSASQIKEIEAESKTKIESDHHDAFFAFADKDGKKTQIGVATVLKIESKEIMVIYENKEGSPIIKELRAEIFGKDFTAQFSGKGHDDKFEIGKDLQLKGADVKQAETLADTIRRDVMTMQILYGKAHKH